MTKVMRDEFGLYVKVNGAKRRPGFSYYVLAPACRRDDGDLKAGDIVRVRMMAGTPVACITTSHHIELFWEGETQ